MNWGESGPIWTLRNRFTRSGGVDRDGWFANKGQATQAIAAIVACVFAGIKAWPDMRSDQLMSIGSILFFLLVVIVVVSVGRAVGGTVRHGSSSLGTAAGPPPAASPAEDQSRSTFRAVVRVETFQVSLGSFVDLPKPFQMRVECKDLRQHTPKEPGEEDYGAVLQMGTSGCLVFGGEKAVKISTNCYYLPLTTFQNREPYSVYCQHFSEGYARFFALYLDHINCHTGIVSVKACVINSSQF